MANKIVNRKCGIINISIKKNGKKVYTFNCWFCDTIYMQMKKFTMHLEQEHVRHLEDGINTGVDGDVFTPEVEVEENSLKSEDEEEPHVFARSPQQTQNTTSFQDPLETVGDDLTLHIAAKKLMPATDDEAENSEVNVPLHGAGDTLNVDAVMKTFSEKDDEVNNDHSHLSGDENTSSSAYNPEDSDDEQLTKWFERKYTKPLENELIVPLLKAFKEIPQLWDTSHTIKYNLNQKPKLLRFMIDNLNGSLKMKLKLNTVKKTLYSLCHQYEEEVERELTQQCVKEEKSELWFYKHMEFMKNAIKFRLKHKKKSKCRMKPLCDELICDLIDIYKHYSVLWDVNNLSYPIKEKRNETMQAMLDEIKNKMNLTLNISKLSKHLAHVHRLYAKDKQHRLECENNQQLFKPSCLFYDKCDFLELNQGPFRCPTCNEIVDTYNDFCVHKSSHDGSMPFICPDCGMGFKKTSYYTTHVKRHLGFFKFHCEICGKGYPFNAELEEHVRSHTGALPYLCSICGEGFGRASTYDNHIRRHEERFKYFCEICKKGFNCMTRLKDHVKAHLNVRDSICTVCSKAFTSRRLLSQHKRIHATKNCICNICGKGFANEIGLRSHKKYHESSGVITDGKSN